MSTDQQKTGIPMWAYSVGAAALIAAAFVAIWFMVPGPDSRLDVVSPSGAVRIELGELCAEVGCSRVAVLDKGGLRSGCPLAIPGNTPLFKQITPTWTTDEDMVTLDYVSALGETGTVVIDLAECTLTE